MRIHAAGNRETTILIFVIMLASVQMGGGFIMCAPAVSSLVNQIQSRSLKGLVLKALDGRKAFFHECDEEGTDCFRVYHGATEGTEGLTIDRYGNTLLFQTFRDPSFLQEGSIEVIKEIEELVNQKLNSNLRAVVSHRGKGDKEFPQGRIYQNVQQAIHEDLVMIKNEQMIGKEQGVVFDVSPRPGKDPWLYLDFRAGRRWLKNHSKGKRVLNAFSYSCTAGICAAVGGAESVWNLDFSPGALDVGEKNAKLNKIEVKTAGVGVKGWPSGGFRCETCST